MGKSFLKYDNGAGLTAKLRDKVVIIHIAGELNNLSGHITGWSTRDHQVAIVTLDSPLLSGETTVGIPVVCLRMN